MDRAQAEAIYDAGRDACVQVLLDLAARVAQHEERLRRLEAQSRQDSRTSSKPPSTDPPKTRQQRRAEARAKAKEWARKDGVKRTAGAQDGHRGAGRKLLPDDQVDEIVDHYPDACRGCGHAFGTEEQRPGRRFGRHQVADLPPIGVIVVEHRTQRLRCRQCRTRTTARLPVGIGSSPFGSRLQAAVVTLTARNRISRREMAELAGELFGVSVSSGAVDAICQRAGDALADPHARLRDWLLAQGVLHVDETGWRTAGDSRALWTATNRGAALFDIAPRCNREQFDELIGAFAGIIVSDRWPGFEHLDPHRRQACWSHLQRDFRRHSEGLAEQKTFGEQGLELTNRLFKAWRAYQHEHQDPARLKADIDPIQGALHALVEHAARKSTRTCYHRGFARNLLKVWPALWTFVADPGVEPTNNPAERALRGPVIHRKLSHGTRSDDGERFAERVLSAAATCRLQSRSLFAYLCDLIAAHTRGDPVPALV